MREATAFAPASVGNVGVGFDVLGLALAAPGDRVTVRRTETPGVHIDSVQGVVTNLPSDAAKNTAGAALIALQERLGLSFGFSVSIDKGIPLGSGMGGSAASAVGAVVAACALMPGQVDLEVQVACAVAGEAVASGAHHADNVAPSLMGGLVLCGPGERLWPIPVPEALRVVLVRPHQRLDTRRSREALQGDVPMATVTAQTARLGAFIAACHAGDAEGLRGVFEDVLVEPRRAPLIPGFAQVKAAALHAGALGCTISGGGPSIVALCTGREREVQAAMIEAFAQHHIASDGWVSMANAPGARVEVD